MGYRVRICISIIAVFVFSTHAMAESKLLCSTTGTVSIYIDPFFGGQEEGPKLGTEYKAKDIQLIFGKKLKTLLEKKGLSACLSRDRDVYMSLDDRLVKAKNSQSKNYFAITMSQQSNNCINLYIPKINPSAVPKNKETEISSIVNDLALVYKHENSLLLAHQLRQSISDILSGICIKIYEENRTPLNKTHCPTVILELGISNNYLPFLRNTILSDSFVTAIADAMVLHSRSIEDPSR